MKAGQGEFRRCQWPIESPTYLAQELCLLQSCGAHGLCFLCIWLFSVNEQVWMSLPRDSLSRMEFLPCFAFLPISRTYLLFLSIVFHGTPRLCATAAVLTPPKPHLRRDWEVWALPPSKAVLGSAVTCCESPRHGAVPAPSCSEHSPASSLTLRARPDLCNRPAPSRGKALHCLFALPRQTDPRTLEILGMPATNKVGQCLGCLGASGILAELFLLKRSLINQLCCSGITQKWKYFLAGQQAQN